VPKGCRFLFPGDVPGQLVVDLKRFWERMRVQADIPDVRIHDLRTPSHPCWSQAGLRWK
jgi:hypothetical protein